MRLFQTSLNSTGSTPTPPTPFPSIVFNYVSGENNVSSFETNYNGANITTGIVAEQWGRNMFEPNIMNHNGWNIDGSQISVKADNMPPVYLERLLTGNHGYAGWLCNVVGHDKTVVDDIYSVWQLQGSDDTSQLILYQINGDDLWVTKRTDGSITAGIYEHISGATNTSSFTITTATNKQFYPSIRTNSIDIYVDDILIDKETDAQYTCKNVKYVEEYDLIVQQDIKDYLVTFQGSGEVTKTIEGTPRVRLINTLIADYTGALSGYQSMEVLIETDFLNLAFIQQVNLLQSGDEWYVPKTKAFTHPLLGTVNFSDKVAYQDLSGSSDVDFGTSTWQIPTSLPDRQIAIDNTDNVYFAHGYLPVLDAEIGERINLTDIACEISASADKYYMRAQRYTKVGTPLPVGYVSEVISYRLMLPQEVDSTCSYFIQDYENNVGYYYGDWHDLPKNFTLDIPEHYIGSSYEIVEKTDNVILSNGILGTTLSIEINNTESYGFLTIKIV